MQSFTTINLFLNKEKQDDFSRPAFLRHKINFNKIGMYNI